MARPGTTKPAPKRKWRESCTNWKSVGHETAYNDILITRAARKPPDYMLEQTDVNGNIINCVLRKLPKGQRGWTLLLPGGGFHEFKTKRKALDFFARLQRLESSDDTQ